jgi:hypothetical protein
MFELLGLVETGSSSKLKDSFECSNENEELEDKEASGLLINKLLICRL